MARSNDPIEILKRDHQRVHALLTRALESEGASDVIAELIEAVEAHSSLEEELVYPAFQEAAAGSEHEKLYFESLEEHALVDSVLAELDPETLEPDVLMAKLKVTKDLISHHVEEEEKELFPLMQKLCSKAALEELGAQLQPTAAGRIDVNHADVEELKLIKGIDGARADRIVKYRDSHGPFHSWEDLAAIEGFDEGMIRTIRDQGELGR